MSEGGLVRIHTLRPSRKNEGGRMFLLEPSEGDVKRKDFRENPEFSYFPGDELCVLRAKIENNDFIHVPILSEMLGSI